MSLIGGNKKEVPYYLLNEENISRLRYLEVEMYLRFLYLQLSFCLAFDSVLYRSFISFVIVQSFQPVGLDNYVATFLIHSLLTLFGISHCLP